MPPVAGLQTLDPEITLDVVQGTPRAIGPGPCLSSSFGFGGHDAVSCSACPPPPPPPPPPPAPPGRAVGAASHLPGQRRPPGERGRERRDQRPDPLAGLPGVDVLVALGAGPRLGDRLPPGVLPRRAGPLRPHLPGVELGAAHRRRSGRGAGRHRGPPALRSLLRGQSGPLPPPAADALPDRPVSPARAEAVGVTAGSGGAGHDSGGPGRAEQPAGDVGVGRPRPLRPVERLLRPLARPVDVLLVRPVGGRGPGRRCRAGREGGLLRRAASTSVAGGSWTSGAVGPRSCARWSSSTAWRRASA